jgi:hypothetical protein
MPSAAAKCWWQCTCFRRCIRFWRSKGGCIPNHTHFEVKAGAGSYFCGPAGVTVDYDLHVGGNLNVVGIKSAVVLHPDAIHRRLCTVESPRAASRISDVQNGERAERTWHSTPTLPL